MARKVVGSVRRDQRRMSCLGGAVVGSVDVVVDNDGDDVVMWQGRG